MRLLPYLEIIKLCKEKIDEKLAPHRANRAKKQGELELAKMEEEIARLETTVQEICTESSIDFKKILDALDEVALAERRHNQLQKVLTELFPKGKK